MPKEQIKYHNKSSFSITVEPSPTLIRAVFIFILLLTIAGPLIGIVLAAKSEAGIKFSNILLLFLFTVIAVYFLKLILWNSFGTEHYTLTKDKIEYEADYKWFKGTKKSFDLTMIQIDIVKLEDNLNGKLHIANPSDEVESSIKVEIEELQILKNWINQKRKNNL